MLAQDFFHSMRKKGRKTRWMTIKINLNKAYDRLKWQFIRETLVDIGLTNHMVNLIQSCFSTPSMNVLWNNEVLEELSLTRGIQKGDPLSLHLFVLCIERHFQLIYITTSQGVWCPIWLSRNGPHINHLALDDVILFAETLLDQVHSIKNILNRFCRSSR